MRAVSEDLVRIVQARAEGRCQYSMMHTSLQGATFHIEHIVPRSKGGYSELANLALACPSCNLHKSSRIEAIDPWSGDSVRLFHPIGQIWSEHFTCIGNRIEGVTAVGRATVPALDLNHPRRQRIREVERRFGLYPPIR